MTDKRRAAIDVIKARDHQKYRDKLKLSEARLVARRRRQAQLRAEDPWIRVANRISVDKYRERLANDALTQATAHTYPLPRWLPSRKRLVTDCK